MSIIIAICGRFTFEALNLPKDMESLSKMCYFQEEIQCHEVTAMKLRGGKKNPSQTVINQNPEEKNTYI